MPVHQRYHQFLSDQRQFFDELITEDWDTYKSEAWDYARAFEVQQLFKRIQPPHILDIGCGCGFHDKTMAEYPFVESVDAIDYSEQSIVRANSEYPHPKVHRTVADFSSFAPENLYDLVVSFSVIEHIPNPEKYFAFCTNVCKPKGMVAVCTPNRRRLNNRIRAFKRQPIEMCDIMHFREYTASEIFKMGKQAGLKPFAWFGRTLDVSHLISDALIKKLGDKNLTKMGTYFPSIANIICVIMRKA